jgi:quinol monooxygenase YgiN
MKGESLMVHATLRMVIRPDRRKEALEILKSACEHTRVQPGCISSRIYEDLQEEGGLMLEEAWRSEEDLEHHLRSDDYWHVLLVTEMAIEPPEFQFRTVSRTTGIETVEKVKGITMG